MALFCGCFVEELRFSNFKVNLTSYTCKTERIVPDKINVHLKKARAKLFQNSNIIIFKRSQRKSLKVNKYVVLFLCIFESSYCTITIWYKPISTQPGHATESCNFLFKRYVAMKTRNMHVVWQFIKSYAGYQPHLFTFKTRLGNIKSCRA